MKTWTFEICSLDQYYWYSTLSEKKSNIFALRNLLDITFCGLKNLDIHENTKKKKKNLTTYQITHGFYKLLLSKVLISYLLSSTFFRVQVFQSSSFPGPRSFKGRAISGPGYFRVQVVFLKKDISQSFSNVLYQISDWR